MDQWRDRAGWGFLAIIGLVLVIVGFMGRFGSLLAVFLAPDQMMSAQGESGASSGEQGKSSDSSSGTTALG